LNEFFFDYFKARIDFVEQNCLKRIEGLILLCCYLDSLAGYRYGGQSTCQRFRDFIVEYSGNESAWKKVSLPLLKAHFIKNKNTTYADFVRKLGVIESNYVLQGYNVDMDIRAMEQAAEGKIITPFSAHLKKEIADFEYVRILWREYRNPAVHEASVYRDEAPDPWGDKREPFYAHVNMWEDGKIGRDKITFAIPAEFILTTLKCCIDKFREYTTQKNIDLRTQIEGRHSD
jgi:hypothetical protein